MIDRRHVMMLGLSYAAASVALAQPAIKPWRIGFINDTPSTAGQRSTLRILIACLHDMRLEEGRDYLMMPRYDNNQPDRRPGLVADLLQQRVDMIVATSTAAALVAKRSTATVPILFTVSADPVAAGLVESLARPGGNVTGMSVMSLDLNGKRVQFIRDIVPSMRSLALLWNPDYPTHPAAVSELEQAARRLEVEVLRVTLRAPDDVDGAIEQLARAKPGAALVVDQPLPYDDGVATRLFAGTSRLRLPVMAPNREQAIRGALVSYGVDFDAQVRRACPYIERILGRGMKPAELPVQQPTDFELIINQKTARAIGVSIPRSLLVRAQEVIE